jgi:(p)ppGpp synthase/HD superfamily hydrolase
MTVLTDRFDEAVAFARRAHAGDVRKDTDIPYLSHLLAVASLVLDQGGGEDEAIAGLLHDTLEDHSGEVVEGEPLDGALLERRFGPTVRRIVEACSDHVGSGPKGAWRHRKQAYLDHLRGIDDIGVLRVSLADKLHNARAIVADWRIVGDDVWKRFNPESDQAWYYGTLLEIHREKRVSDLVGELEVVVAELVRIAPARSRGRGAP